MKFLVTAGNTRERIDQVRDWGNIFTGNTGYSIARAMTTLGDVDLLTSNRAHLAEIPTLPSSPGRLTGEPFTSHAQLRQSLEHHIRTNSYDAVFMTAAIADYKPTRTYSVLESRPGDEPGTEIWVVKDVTAGKVKSNHKRIAITGEQTEKLVDLYRTAWAYRGLLVKFKLEVGITPDQLIQIGQASRTASGADYLVANTLDMVDGPNAGAYLLGENLQEWIPRGTLAPRLKRLVEETLIARRIAGNATQQ